MTLNYRFPNVVSLRITQLIGPVSFENGGRYFLATLCLATACAFVPINTWSITVKPPLKYSINHAFISLPSSQLCIDVAELRVNESKHDPYPDRDADHRHQRVIH